jgi:hypothetical protein
VGAEGEEEKVPEEEQQNIERRRWNSSIDIIAEISEKLLSKDL